MMGSNYSSSDASDDDLNDEENVSDEEGDVEKEISTTLDVSTLFDTTALRNLASKAKDDIPENVVQQHNSTLIRWLEEKQQQNEETVTQSQFYDVLMNKNVNREDCMQAFQQFDSEGDGMADVATMLEALRSSTGNKVQEEMAHVVRTLQACSLMPGFIDVYNEDKQTIGQHGARLLNYLLRNRAPSLALPFPILVGFNSTTQMRLVALDNFFAKLSETATRQMEKLELHDGEEMKPIAKCFSSIDVSSNKVESWRLFNRDFSNYWQSDGNARSHWIRFRMKSNVVVKQLSIGVSASDQSYMPNHVTISVGKSAFNLREIKEVKIPSHTTGSVNLLEDLKTFYPVMQINIKRCQSDGCDTRVHFVKIVGCRIVKESGVTVTDAAAAWYLSILSSTTLASISTSPGLRDIVLNHTRQTLKHIPPLALGPYSSDRPPFLSTHVLKELEKFLQDIASCDSVLSLEGLQVLLAFNLARGHITGILNTIIMLQTRQDEALELRPLLDSLDRVRDNFWKKQGSLLSLTLAGFDGGEKEETTGPSNMMAGNWSTTQVYLSGDGKTLVNMFFNGPEHVQITKIRLKVDKGPRGPKCGLIFVYKDSEPFNLEKHVERFAGFDSWRSVQYQFCNSARSAGITKKEDIPVAFFTIEEDWDEVEVTMDAYPIGKYVLVKFLEPRQTSAERLGISGIKFYGFHRKAVFLSNNDVMRLLPKDEPEEVTGVTALPKVMSFLTCLARDQQESSEKKSVSMKSQSVDISDVSIELLWRLYNGFSDRLCQVLTLQLLHALFPFLASSKHQHRETSELFVNHLCSLMDNPSSEPTELEAQLYLVAKQVIIDGAAVFFPDKEARRKQLFSMMNNSAIPQEAVSVTLTFQSLCQFFSNVDPSGLLDLPNVITEGFTGAPVLHVLETLISVASREFHKVLMTVELTDEAPHLVQLLSSLQTSLLSWAHRQITGENKDHASTAQNMLVKYMSLLGAKVTSAMNEFAKVEPENMMILLAKLEMSFLSTVLRQLVLILTMLTDNLSSLTRTQLLAELVPICKELRRLSPLLPQVFYKIDSDAWRTMESGEVVLRSWDVESSHNYENNLHTKQIFSCPGATTFIVDFDPRCETEKRYDYLEFTDSRGMKVRYDQKVGSEKWPSKTVFKGGHRLQFLFHSDSSNNEWGYKFKVTAKGCPDVPLCWLYDLELSLAKLCGKLSGATLDVNQVLPKAHTGDEKTEAELDLLRSELWTTLFRGGYMVGKLQRSFSGKHTAEESAEVIGFIVTLSEGDDQDELVNNFFKRVEESSKSQKLGGADITEAVRAVFAALLWHTQALREDIEKYIKLTGECKISDGIQQAYSTADSLRLHFIRERQKLKLVLEKSMDKSNVDAAKVSTEAEAEAQAKNLSKQSDPADKENNPEKTVTEDFQKKSHESDTPLVAETYDPVSACKQKALFLLKFAGLSKVHLRSDIKNKYDRRISKLHNKLQLQHGDKFYKLDTDRHPSFRLVLDFVRDAAWSKERVEQLLRQRAQHAQAVSEVYMAAAEFIRIQANEHIFQIPNVIFLQEMFSFQDKFAKHYADGLDGCGLDLENRVRRSYYTLIRRMVDSVRGIDRKTMSRSLMCCYDLVLSCTLHLLDVNWQLYDLFLLVDLKLPDLYLKQAKESVSMREKTVGEVEKDKEIGEYNKNMKWLEECNTTSFFEWYSKHNTKKDSADKDKDDKKAVQMFVARFCDLLDVEISCDGCSDTLPGRRYRCLQCMDMDLCSSCYAGGVKPDGEHNDEHEIVHLQYKCDECYAFIVGTRIHCNQCENFDLCLGCHEKGHFPAGHTSDHMVATYPMVKWKTNKEAESSVLSYIHQHVWVLFCSMALNMANLLYSSIPSLQTTPAIGAGDDTSLPVMPLGLDIRASSLSLDPDYIKAATQLYNTSIELAVKCLMQVSVPDDLETIDDDTPDAVRLRQEEAFAIHSQERIMGLLGSMLPPENKTPLAEDVSLVFSSEEFMSLLFYIAIGESGHDTNTQHFAMGLIGQLLQRTTTQCKLVDRAVALAQARQAAEAGTDTETTDKEGEDVNTKPPKTPTKTNRAALSSLLASDSLLKNIEAVKPPVLPKDSSPDTTEAVKPPVSTKGASSDTTETVKPPVSTKDCSSDTTEAVKPPVLAKGTSSHALDMLKPLETIVLSGSLHVAEPDTIKTSDSGELSSEGLKNSDVVLTSDTGRSKGDLKDTDTVKTSDTAKSTDDLTDTDKVKTDTAKSTEDLKDSDVVKTSDTGESTEDLKDSDVVKTSDTAKSTEDTCAGAKKDPISTPQSKPSSESIPAKTTQTALPQITEGNESTKQRPVTKPDVVPFSWDESGLMAAIKSKAEERQLKQTQGGNHQGTGAGDGPDQGFLAGDDFPSMESSLLSEVGDSLGVGAGDAEAGDGQKTADFLFTFGATCMERSGLEWAYSMAGIIQKLFNSPMWRPVLLKHLTSLIDNRKQNPVLSSIFALFVVAGFPEVLSIGSCVKYTDIGTELKEGIVLKHFPDKNQTLLVDKKNRKRRTLKDEYIDIVSQDIQILSQNHITGFINMITNISARIRNGESVGVLNTWVLSLTLKALLKTLLSSSDDRNPRLFSPEFVRCVVYLASQGTGFSKQWLLKDLEILSLMLYTREREEQDSKDSKDVKADIIKSPGGSTVVEGPLKESTPDDSGQNPLEGLDDTTKLCFQNLHEMLSVPLSVLRAIYDLHGKDPRALLMEVHKNVEGDLTPNEEILELAKKWESIPASSSIQVAELAADKAVDTGVQSIAVPGSTTRSRTVDQAEEEPAEVTSCPFTMADNDIRNNIKKQRRAKSTSLLQKELEVQGKNCSRDFLNKVNMAMTVLYARQVLTALLADWSTEGHVITAQLLGCKDNTHVPFVLDLLQRPDSSLFQKVVQNVIKHCAPDSLVPIAMTSCQFMEEVNLSTVTKESLHNYKNNCSTTDKVHIPGAPFLSVKFDSRCATEESCDELTLSSSADYKADKHVFSGPREKWVDFDLPGDTLYMKFTSDCSHNDWGYRFTVTGGRMGRFDTGYMVLSGVLSVPSVIRKLHVDKLWESLVYVACKQTGQQRLKALQLMLNIMLSQFRQESVLELSIDLSLLRPLWSLYNKMTSQGADSGPSGDGGIMPSVVRALTELFLKAEDLAMNWGKEAEYAANLLDTDDIRTVAYQAVLNVAAISEMISVTNQATEGFKALEEKLAAMKTT